MATIDLHAKLAAAEKQLVVQARKCENLIAFFSSQIKSLTEELKGEKSWRTNHMENIFKALLRFESKLKTDQQTIRRQLYEKDGQLNRLHREIVVLREKYGVTAADTRSLKIDEVAQYCPACRKEYHLLGTKSVQVQVHSRRCETSTTTTTDTSSTQSVEYLSSSEEGGLAPSFVEARRSKKYMSKRTSGTFRDYLRSRSTDPNVSSPELKSALTRRPSDLAAGAPHKSHMTYDRRRPASSIGTTPVMAPVRRASSMRDSSYSSYINDAHGFRRSMPDTSSPGSQTDKENIPEEPDDDEVFIDAESMDRKGPDGCSVTAANGGTEFESTDDWYASVSDMEDSDSALAKPYGYNAVNPVLECVNQILLQQSMDCTIDNQSDTYEPTSKAMPCPPTALATSPPIQPKDPATRTQKRVHFSTQNSMVQVPRSDSFHYDEHPANSGTHHQPNSTQIHAKSLPINHQQQFSYESVYSNEYEPIGSEGTCSVATTNHYVDMDAKHDNAPMFILDKHPKLPPALPPKPSNLLKIRNVVRNVSSFGLASPLPLSGDDIDNETEPDYASILEVSQMPRRITQEVIVDVHKSDDSMSKCNSVDLNTSDFSTDESFADVPKLPNVAAIISPKKDVVCPAVINQDNYVTRSPVNLQAKPSLPQSILTKNAHNQRIAPIPPIKSHQPPPKAANTQSQGHHPAATHPIMCPIPVYQDKLQLQAEFDWYNLDVEYCKSKSESHNDMDDGSLLMMDDHTRNIASVEYKLDEEFVLSSHNHHNGHHSNHINNNCDTEHHFGRSISHEDTIIEDEDDEREEQEEGYIESKAVEVSSPNSNVPKQTTKPASTRAVLAPSQPSCPQLPARSLYKPFEAETFETFLKETGLTTKPLPRKRKIFY